MNRIARIAGPAVLLLVGFVALLTALVIGGGANPALIADPGPVVRFGLPIARLVVDLSAATTIGGLALATMGLSRSGPEWNRAIDVAAGASGVWTVASAVATFCTFLSVAGSRISIDEQFGQSMGVFLTGTELGLAWLVTVLVAAAVTVLCFAVRSRGMVALTAGVSMIGLIPLAQQGHAAGTASHDAAVTALGLHLVGAALWVGGLVMLVLLRGVLPGDRLAAVVARYSSIALGCFVLVAVSGTASAQIRVGALSNLFTPYGTLVLVKIGAIVAIGVLGAVQRRRAIRALTTSPDRQRPFWTLIVVELAVMGVASGFAAALGRTATPVDQIALSKTTDPSPAELLTDDLLPHAPGAWGWLTQWNVDLFWLMAAVLLAATYVAGVVRLRRSGVRWPARRSIAAALAVVSLVVATSGSLHQYDRFLVSANVGAHVLLGLVVPALVWAAAPVALIRAAVHPRNDDSTGVREWTDVIVEHPSVRYLAQPFPAFLLAAALWWAFFATDAVRWSVSDPTGRTVSDAVFLLVGLLAVPTLCTPIPAGHRRPTTAAVAVRIVGAVVIAAGTVSLGIAMRGPLGLLQASWFGAMGRTWGPDPLVDQARAGLVLIVAGVLLLVTVVVVVLVRLRRDGGDPVDVVDAAAAGDAAVAGPTAAAEPAARVARDDQDDLDFDDGSDDLEPSPGADAR
ncbi:bifunctional copper resistance protein CopD/cytochrome c oxidase assembly protein [Curtobacterium flaccumfaciens]|uniref:bifunctional copper resistance protein CopD/cytochrome c oxidase assembly protein n=1 Tax=Curtobacterium flaccumfaciens TaxID=2035 RepID=UPI00265AD002|nr:bifunctional copper resistance protein CopD/cytochrome c oxidase assembly protein [Curtobacterium flaccumfaciens]MCS5518959.1 bifunctional copper resistance protein CopD/cytochrome c oxidase assembly protein [Curtobacterium flaccumfaciens]